MGRKTYESLGKPLPGRLNIVLSGNKDLPVAQGVVVLSHINEAIERLQSEDAEEGFIIGGGKIFAATLALADRMYITRVHTIVEAADATFPAIDHTHWKLVWEEKHKADDKHLYDFDFQQYERVEM